MVIEFVYHLDLSHHELGFGIIVAILIVVNGQMTAVTSR